jgi:hypothetical protein
MTKEKFKEYFKLQQGISERYRNLYNNGVDLIDYDNEFYLIIELLGKELFGEYGWDHVSNFEMSRKEKYSREKPMCWDSETEEPFYWDLDSLWDFMIKEKYILVKES